MTPGHLAAIAAYLLWGLFPLYWQFLSHVDPFQLICHRIVWSFVALVVAMFAWRRHSYENLKQLRGDPRSLGWSGIAACLIAVNWYVFVWCVQNDAVVESALGYFMTPLMSVALGVIVLRERLDRFQWLAVAMATVGVAYITLRLGGIPWMALTLASSFALYGIVKKRMAIAAIPGLWLETAILLIPAVAVLQLRAQQGLGEFGIGNRLSDLLIICAGPVTTLPLVLFSYGAQRIPLSQLGLLQYIAPSIQFVVGMTVFREQVSLDRWIGFFFVWGGLVVFAYSSERRRRAKRQESRVAPPPKI